MAAVHYRVDSSKATSLTIGPQLLNIIENINQAFAQLALHRAAMIQMQDDTSGTDTEFVTISKTYGFVDGTDTISSTIAHQAFTAIDSFYTTCQASLQQMGAQFKQ